jgi:hypothetical protein
VKPKTKIFGLFRCFKLISKQPKQTELFRIIPKQPETTLNFLKKYQNMLSFKLFRLVFCLFRFNRKIETHCFGIEFETTETNCSGTNRKQAETTQNNTKLYEKIPIYALYQTVSVGLLFVSVQSKHRNSLSVKKRNNRNKQTSFGSSFGYFESKLVSKDTLHKPTALWSHTYIPTATKLGNRYKSTV